MFACDIDEKCRETYEKNYGLKPHADITKVNVAEIPDFDVLCAGFPCFVAGTRVLTNKGYKPIETVELTDKLLTHTGNMQKILNLQQKMYTGKLLEFEIKYHPELIVATEEHPFYVRTKFGEPQWKIASEITMDDYFGMVINTNEIIPELSFVKTPHHWFLLGYWVANRFEINDAVFDSINKSEWYNEIPEWFQDAPKEFIQEFVNRYIKADGLKKTRLTDFLTSRSQQNALELFRPLAWFAT